MAGERVIHILHPPPDVSPFLIEYIGRANRRHGLSASIYANPFVIGRDGDRAEVLAQYREWAPQQPRLMAALPSLAGKVLACWCKWPNRLTPCHGDILIEMLDAVESARYRALDALAAERLREGI